MTDSARTREPLLGLSNERGTYGSLDDHQSHTHEPQRTKIVHFLPGDAQDPRNWPRWRKWLMIGPILLIDLSVSWGASGFSPASQEFGREFGLPAGMGTLGLSSYVLGLAFGPMTLAPLSEVRGSKYSRLATRLTVPRSTTEGVRSTSTPISSTSACSPHQLSRLAWPSSSQSGCFPAISPLSPSRISGAPSPISTIPMILVQPCLCTSGQRLAGLPQASS